MENHPEKNSDMYRKLEIDPEKKIGKSFKFSYLFEILFKPTQTFKEIITAGHVWIWPYLFRAILGVLSYLIVMSFASSEESAHLMNSLNDAGAGVVVIVSIVLIIFIVPLLFTIMILPAAILMFIRNVLLGGKASFRQLLNVDAYSSMTTVPMIIITIILSMIFQEVTNITFSPAMFLPTAMMGTFIYLWLSSFSIFTVWYLILLIKGLAILYRDSQAKTAAWLIPLFLAATTFFSVVVSAISSAVVR